MCVFKKIKYDFLCLSKQIRPLYQGKSVTKETDKALGKQAVLNNHSVPTNDQ